MKFVKEARAWGLTVSLEKTKGMALNMGIYSTARLWGKCTSGRGL